MKILKKIKAIIDEITTKIDEKIKHKNHMLTCIIKPIKKSISKKLKV